MLGSFRRSQSSHWETEITIIFFIVDKEFVGKIDKNPREDRILSQITVGSSSQVVDFLKILKVADFVVEPFFLKGFIHLARLRINGFMKCEVDTLVFVFGNFVHEFFEVVFVEIEEYRLAVNEHNFKGSLLVEETPFENLFNEFQRPYFVNSLIFPQPIPLN